MLHPFVSKSTQPKNLPMQNPDSELSKQSIPLWVIVLFLFLISLIIGMGIYIGFQNNWFQTKPSSLQTAVMPTPSSSEETGTRTLRTTMKPDGSWLTYTNAEAGFTLLYPPTALLNGEAKGATVPVLAVSSERISDIPEDLPLNMGRSAVLADKALLEKNIAKTVGDFPASDALVRIGGTYNGRMTSVLSRFEVCSVILTRTLVFYKDDRRISISLIGPQQAIVESMPEFFTIDSSNCGQMPMWNREKMGAFMPTLAQGKGKGRGQEWYDTFDGIIQTIVLTSSNEAVLPSVTSTSTPTAPSTQSCEVSDPAFCNVLNDIKQSITAKNYSGIIVYQNTTTITCDPDGMFVAICEGVAKGVVKTGYSIGYNQSEGSIQTRDAHLASITSYVNESGPFLYKGSLQQGDKGVIVYLNGDASKLFALNLKRAGMTWRFDSILVGGTWGDTRYIDLSPSLLE